MWRDSEAGPTSTTDCSRPDSMNIYNHTSGNNRHSPKGICTALVFQPPFPSALPVSASLTICLASLSLPFPLPRCFQPFFPSASPLSALLSLGSAFSTQASPRAMSQTSPPRSGPWTSCCRSHCAAASKTPQTLQTRRCAPSPASRPSGATSWQRCQRLQWPGAEHQLQPPWPLRGRQHQASCCPR